MLLRQQSLLKETACPSSNFPSTPELPGA